MRECPQPTEYRLHGHSGLNRASPAKNALLVGACLPSALARDYGELVIIIAAWKKGKWDQPWVLLQFEKFCCFASNPI